MSSVTSPGPLSPAISAAAESILSNSEKQKGSEDEREKIERKDFFWDQFLAYMATIIALLTVLDVTLQFFRGGGLSCRVPAAESVNGTAMEPTRDEVAFINTFCQESLSRAEYYPLFVLIQGLLLAAPQYLWVSLFGGEFDFFLGLVQQLDRLRDSKTGQYRTQNFEIVDKLEKHFPQQWKLRSIFSLYVTKLGIQFVVIFTAIIINGAFFQRKYFSFTFKCPRDFNIERPPEGWWLPVDVVCVFTSFRLHQTIQNVNYLLLCLALVAVVYGLVWCFTRHSNVLGYRDVALFAFNSCLRPEDHVTTSFFKPRILNDLDFLMMQLFQADSGCGNVFKDIQIERELSREVKKDHEYLYILIDAIKDSERDYNDRRVQKEKRNKERIQAGGAEQTGQPQSSSEDEEMIRLKDIADLYQSFLGAKFNTDPGKSAHELLGKPKLGNVTWNKTAGIRHFIYGFFKGIERNKMALDISFGTIGYSLTLSRAFQEVVSLNFHSYYNNDKEPCRKEVFHTNYSVVTFSADILATRRESLVKLDETLHDLYRKDRKAKARLPTFIKNNLVVIGPIREEARTATVNLFIERQQAAQRFDKDCKLLTIRPLRIGGKDVTSRFYKLIPQKSLFEAQPMDPIKEKLRVDTEGKISFATVGDYEGIPMKCHQTECVFEILVYKYIGHIVLTPDPPLHPPKEGGAKVKMADPPQAHTTSKPKNAQHAEENKDNTEVEIIDLET